MSRFPSSPRMNFSGTAPFSGHLLLLIFKGLISKEPSSKHFEHNRRCLEGAPASRPVVWSHRFVLERETIESDGAVLAAPEISEREELCAGRSPSSAQLHRFGATETPEREKPFKPASRSRSHTAARGADHPQCNTLR